MGFFDMGLMEILLILAIALIIWGPGKLPEIARTIGKAIYTLRKASADLTSTVTKELSMEEKDRLSKSKAKSDDKTKESSDTETAESSTKETTSPKD